MRSNRSESDGATWATVLSEAVRQRRKALNLSQLELAQLSGCGTAFLYGLENGKPSLRLDKVIDVLKVLGLRMTLEPGQGGIAFGERLK
ncbi:MAG: helix-turn-helix domain-containing protein [Myxococcaceae bacterium]